MSLQDETLKLRYLLFSWNGCKIISFMKFYPFLFFKSMLKIPQKIV